MASKIGNAAADEARDVPELDLLARGADRENNSVSALAQAAASITVVIGGSAVGKGRPRFSRNGFTYTPAKTRKYEAHGRLAAQFAMSDRPPLTGPVQLTALIEWGKSNWSFSARFLSRGAGCKTKRTAAHPGRVADDACSRRG